MNKDRFHFITRQYAKLRVGVLGDFCLDRYLEIDPTKEEISIETGLPVHNVVRVRPQPGGAGTIVNNLSALGIGSIYPIGFAGQDGEGFELWQAMEKVPAVDLRYFVRTEDRRTFTYCKPLVIHPGKPPVELNRLDSKNWTPTPVAVEKLLSKHVETAALALDALIVLDQVDVPDTGVVTRNVQGALRELLKAHPKMPILADSRRGLREYPAVIFKMNATELAALTGAARGLNLEEIKRETAGLARKNERAVFVSMAGQGILAAGPEGEICHVPAMAVRGEIDIVGAGDAVSANLAAALAAGAQLTEAIELANAAASVVIHKLGTTGTANVQELSGLLLS